MSLAVVMLRPVPAAAQLSRRDLSTGTVSIAVGQKVTVTTEDGRRTNGKVLAVTPTALDISVGGETRSLAIADITRVQQSDSTKNGVIKGALSLGLAGFLVGSFVDAGNAAGEAVGSFFVILLGGEPPPIHHTSNYLTGAVVGVAAGGLLGYALDAGHEKTIFERETTGMSVAVRPIVSNAGKGVGINIRW
jgi:hypothetical protein